MEIVPKKKKKKETRLSNAFVSGMISEELKNEGCGIFPAVNNKKRKRKKKDI